MSLSSFIHYCSPFIQIWVSFFFSSLVASLVAQSVKKLPAVQETWVWSLGQEDPLEKEMATHSSILDWRIPWTEEPGGLQSMRWQKVQFSFSSVQYSFSSVQLLSCVRFFVTPWTAARQASLSITNCQSLPKPMSIESVMPSSHPVLCHTV